METALCNENAYLKQALICGDKLFIISRLATPTQFKSPVNIELISVTFRNTNNEIETTLLSHKVSK